MTCERVRQVLGGVFLQNGTEKALLWFVFHRWAALLDGQPVEDAEVFSEGIFALKIQQSIIFKISKDILDRWQHVERGSTICKARNLTLLVLPRQSLLKLTINVEEYWVIAEERLHLTHDLVLQSSLYNQLALRLNPALQQLVTFIIEAGFSDVDFRNCPIIDQELQYGVTPRIALVDLENCVSPMLESACLNVIYERAFFGQRPSIRGLLRCVTPANFETICLAAMRKGVDLHALGPYKRITNERCLELEQACQYAKVLSEEQVFLHLVRQFVSCLMRSVASTSAICDKVHTKPVSPKRWGFCSGAPRRFQTLCRITDAEMTLRGVLVLDLNSKPVATAILVEGIPKYEFNRQSVSESMTTFFNSKVEVSAMREQGGVLSCYFSRCRSAEYEILKSNLRTFLKD